MLGSKTPAVLVSETYIIILVSHFDLHNSVYSFTYNLFSYPRRLNRLILSGTKSKPKYMLSEVLNLPVLIDEILLYLATSVHSTVTVCFSSIFSHQRSLNDKDMIFQSHLGQCFTSTNPASC